MSITVHTQAELDEALADNALTIYIESDSGVCLTIRETGSSRVVARVDPAASRRGESSSVEARENSRVVASKYVAIHLWSQHVTLTGEGHVIDFTEIDLSDPAQWCDFHGVEVTEGIAYVYKAVGDDWKSDYGVDYSPGSTPEATDWYTVPQCGQGLHFCASPVGSLGYKRDATKFVKVGVRLDEIVTLDDKIKAKRVVVACVEVDRHGELLAVTP